MLDEILARLGALSEESRAALARETRQATDRLRWIPNPGPQTDAYFCSADVLLYGGQGGGGKTDLLLGLAFMQHRRSLIMRRQYTDLGALTERLIEINGGRNGFNGSAPAKLRTADGRLIELGAAAKLGDEQHWQGQPHDFKGFDEAAQFLEVQVRFILGWNRSTDPMQRCRAVLATNPPLGPDGQWLIGMFRPWLDITHPNPAPPGELRWFVTDPDGKDREVDGPAPLTLAGKTLIPQSRTFIPAALKDNPFLVTTGYQAQLDALPEPYRAAVRDGNFMAARKDDEFQLIPTVWVMEARARWKPGPPPGIPMTAMGYDVAGGGDDDNVIAARHDGWYAALVVVPGAKTPLGTDAAGLVVAHRRDGAVVVIDMGGGYGGAPYAHLRDNGVDVIAYQGAQGSTARTRDRKLGFVNKRSEAWWKFREALDPGQTGGSPVALPDDPQLLADLTAPRFEIGPRGIKVEAKESVVDRLGRSPDRGDAVVMAWSEGEKGVVSNTLWRPDQRDVVQRATINTSARMQRRR